MRQGKGRERKTEEKRKVRNEEKLKIKKQKGKKIKDKKTSRGRGDTCGKGGVSEGSEVRSRGVGGGGADRPGCQGAPKQTSIALLNLKSVKQTRHLKLPGQ